MSTYTEFSFNDGYAFVEIKGKGCNFINKERKYISEQWYEDARSFNDGYALVQLNGKWNFIDTDGKFILSDWYDYIWYDDEECVYRIRDEVKGWNYMDKELQPLFSTWYGKMDKFRDELCTVYDKEKKQYNIITWDGDYISNIWFDKVCRLTIDSDEYDGWIIAMVYLPTHNWVFLNIDGEFFTLDGEAIKI